MAIWRLNEYGEAIEEAKQRARIMLMAGGSKNTFPSWTFPGGYPLIYITDDAGALCPHCVNNESEVHFAGPGDGWRVDTVSIHWEGAPKICDHCARPLASAYGEPDKYEKADAAFRDAVHRWTEGQAISPGTANDCGDCEWYGDEPTNEFSKSSCDSCGDSHHGSRDAAHAITGDGQVIHYDICPDCVQYHANGTTPGQSFSVWNGYQPDDD